ncbi:hypothetical protein CLF_112871 [Clonorchis sinensis]|uniref:Reverse transcriptase domain-containing protein n=1 Tax=Clonorchis sinensis TaxID=79923 RepID=G7YX66_CLOSI|nr:hypothetical protein CLF_112871 [Clonorchis sinensis]
MAVPCHHCTDILRILNSAVTDFVFEMIGLRIHNPVDSGILASLPYMRQPVCCSVAVSCVFRTSFVLFIMLFVTSFLPLYHVNFWRLGFRHTGVSVENDAHLDNIFVFEEKENAQVFLDELIKVISFDMHFELTKCKVMLLDMQSLNTPLAIRAETLKIVDRFTYFGSCINSNFSVTDDINDESARLGSYLRIWSTYGLKGILEQRHYTATTVPDVVVFLDLKAAFHLIVLKTLYTNSNGRAKIYARAFADIEYAEDIALLGHDVIVMQTIYNNLHDSFSPFGIRFTVANYGVLRLICVGWNPNPVLTDASIEVALVVV